MPRCLEIFSGTKSVSRVAEALGWECISVDICPRHWPTICDDIRNVEPHLRALNLWEPGSFDFVWASPPCETYSTARTTGRGGDPVTREEDMVKSDVLVAETLRILQHLDAPFCVENPAMSRLWRRQVAQPLSDLRVLVSYCQYGFPYRKNTALAASFPLVLPVCPGAGKCAQMVGKRHLEMAQRGGRAGTATHTLDELHRIPEELVREILGQLHEHTTRSHKSNADASGSAAS